MSNEYSAPSKYQPTYLQLDRAYRDAKEQRDELLEALQATQIDLIIMRGNVFSAAKTENRWDGMVGLIDEWLTRNDEAIAKALGK